MNVTYREYLNLGYSVTPKKDYARFSGMAEKSVKRFLKKKPAVTDDNKRAFCEICDLYYANLNKIDKPLAAFSNDNYKEQYFQSDNQTLNQRVFDIMQIYFTREQLFRGV